MVLKTLNGETFKKLISAGAINLRNNYEEVDNLNVFPVPDGDTGTNMCRTIENGVAAIEKIEDNNIGVIGKALSSGMLLGARGNSGVILSQIFRGICKGLAGKEEINAAELAAAYKMGVKQAYGAVVTPVEGTILTVFREATEFAEKSIKPKSTINEFFELHLEQAIKTLNNTKNLLPVLKEADVIDSGGCGYVYIVKGIVRFLDGEKVEAQIVSKQEETKEAPVAIDFNAFGPDDVIKFGYCTEFILRLQNSKVDVESFDVQTVIDVLEGKEIAGDSIVALKDDSIVKVHVHTLNPGIVLDQMRKFGEFLTIKIENMALQHNETVSEEEREAQVKMEHKKYAVVAVASGAGIKEQFKAFGVDYIVDGGQTMNPSTEDFIRVFKKLDAENIIVFPNNKNIVMAAKQAAKLYKGAHIEVIMSTSIPQCFSALSMLDFSSDDLDIILGNFNEAIRNVNSAEVTVATRSTTINGVNVHKGDYIGILDGKLVASSKSRTTCLNTIFRKVKNIKDKDVITFIFGKDLDQAHREKAIATVNQKYPHIECGGVDGGQSVYLYYIAIE